MYVTLNMELDLDVALEQFFKLFLRSKWGMGLVQGTPALRIPLLGWNHDYSPQSGFLLTGLTGSRWWLRRSRPRRKAGCWQVFGNEPGGRSLLLTVTFFPLSLFFFFFCPPPPPFLIGFIHLYRKGRLPEKRKYRANDLLSTASLPKCLR